MNYSSYQLKLFETYSCSNSNIVVSAGPGSGKTTSVVHMLKYKKPNRSTLFVSFSRAIVEELKHKLPYGVHASTVHGACFRNLIKHYGGHAIVDEDKVLKFAYKVLGKPEIKESINQFKNYVAEITRCIDKYRLFLCNSFNELNEVLSLSGDRIDENQYVHMSMVLEAIEKYHKSPFSRQNPLRVDFVDQLYLTYKNNIPVVQYDEVIVDEAQDCSVLQQKLIQRMIRKGGRFIAVGDPKQAIFGFIGSDPHAFDVWLQKPNTIKLDLPISYRCSKESIKAINTIYSGVESDSACAEGSITTGEIDQAKSGDFVLCRNNAPLFEAYFYLSSKGKKCYIRDNDFTKKILALLEPYKNISTLEGLTSVLATHLVEIVEELREKGNKYPTKHKKYEDAKELIDIVFNMSKRFKTPIAIINALDSMLRNKDESGIQLMTFHKSKGLESTTVFLIRLDKWPSKFATTESQILQERNLLFVALSRSKQDIVVDTDFDDTKDGKASWKSHVIYKTIIKKYENEPNTEIEISDLIESEGDSETD